LALDQLGVKPSATVTFGDQASRDGGAAALGIVTVILPQLLSLGTRGLDRFLTLF
jgi:FMN phosphatase YigB (HAD superfamily)